MRVRVPFGVALTGSVAVCFLLLGVGFAGAASRPVKVVQVSRCVGGNAEPEQAVDGQFVYEAWMGCQGIGFARSVNGGRKFGPSRIIGTGHLWDPAVAVAPNGTVYVSYMTGTLVSTSGGTVAEMVPAVAVSSNHGQSFAPGTDLPVPTPTDPNGNWGDRDFIAVGPDGTVYVTWDYGPSEAEVKTLCDPSGSCAYSNGDFNAVIQKSTDGGKTWTLPKQVSPGFPLGGVYSAPIVAEANGTLDVLYVQHPTDPTTLAVSPGGEYFTRSTDGGTTWSSPIAVDPQAGMVNLPEWWIDGSLAVDPSGNLYATWDTQTATSDTGWLAWSIDSGKTWSTPLRVTSGSTERLIEVAASGTGSVYIGWQTPIRSKGYATYLRRLAVGQGWTGHTKKISTKYGSRGTWPGDTFGLSTRGNTAIVSWGSSDKIWATHTALPAH